MPSSWLPRPRAWPDPRPFLAVVLLNSGDGIAGTLVPLYLDDRGFAVSAIGLLVALASVMSLVSRVPSALLYRRQRAQRLLYLSIVAQGLSTAAYAVAGDAALFALVRSLYGLATGMATTVNMALFLDSLPPGGDRHRHLAAYASAMSAGYTLGGLGGGFFGEWLGYERAFVCAGGCVLLSLFCVTAPLPENRPAAAATVTRTATGLGPAGRLRGALAALSHPAVLNVSLVSFFLAVGHAFGQTFVPLYAAGIGLSLAQIGAMRSAHSLINTLARPFCGELTRLLGYNRVATLGLLVLAGMLMLTPFQSGLVGLTLLFLGVGAARAAVLVANTLSVADVQEGAVSRGMAVGVYHGARDLGAILGPIVGGYLAAALGLRGFFFVGPPLMFALYGLLLWWSTRQATLSAGAAPR